MAGNYEENISPGLLSQRNWSTYTTLGEANSAILFKTPGLEIYIISEDAFYYWSGSVWVKETVSGSSTIDNKYFNVQYYEIINSGTSGTLTAPQGSGWGDKDTILLDQFGGGIDCFISTVQSGFPTGESIGDISTANLDDVVVATLNSSGNWVLIGTPAAYPIAIIYYYQVKLVDFDVTYSVGSVSSSVLASEDLYAVEQKVQRESTVTISGARNSTVTDVYLQGPGNNFMNTSPFILPYDATLTQISISTNGAATWIAEIRNNGVLIPGAFISVIGISSTYASFNISISAGSEIMLFCNGTDIPNPRIDCIFKRN